MALTNWRLASSSLLQGVSSVNVLISALHWVIYMHLYHCMHVYTQSPLSYRWLSNKWVLSLAWYINGYGKERLHAIEVTALLGSFAPWHLVIFSSISLPTWIIIKVHFERLFIFGFYSHESAPPLVTGTSPQLISCSWRWTVFFVVSWQVMLKRVGRRVGCFSWWWLCFWVSNRSRPRALSWSHVRP